MRRIADQPRLKMDSVVLEIFLSSTLKIENLNGLIALLERHKYNKASYYQLGLHLQLHDNTLKSIEKEHKGQVDRCFTECLSHWLRKVDGVANPTIDTLIDALRGIGENAVADGINEQRIHSLPSNEIINQVRLTATPTSEVNENRPDQPIIQGIFCLNKLFGF
uniref:Death domain-containing protein n=1 Tax=Amphimedon queenslandica TaxID=400682 RepID=A0A1X7TQ57_AMPQE